MPESPNVVLQAKRQVFRKEEAIRKQWEKKWSWLTSEQHKVQDAALDVIKEHKCCLVDPRDKFYNWKVKVFKKIYEVDYELPKSYPVTTNQVYGRLPRYDCDKHEIYRFY